jgi:hypothetical protein
VKEHASGGSEKGGSEAHIDLKEIKDLLEYLFTGQIDGEITRRVL